MKQLICEQCGECLSKEEISFDICLNCEKESQSQPRR